MISKRQSFLPLNLLRSSIFYEIGGFLAKNKQILSKNQGGGSFGEKIGVRRGWRGRKWGGVGKGSWFDKSNSTIGSARWTREGAWKFGRIWWCFELGVLGPRFGWFRPPKGETGCNSRGYIFSIIKKSRLGVYRSKTEAQNPINRHQWLSLLPMRREGASAILRHKECPWLHPVYQVQPPGSETRHQRR